MAGRLRLVVDPGVHVSAAIVPIGNPRRILEAWRDARIELVVSPTLLAELKGVLERDKLRRYLGVSDAQRYLALLRAGCELRADPRAVPRVTPDRKDDYLVALAQAVSADYLVSGDAHLTGLADVDPRVLTPQELVRILDSAPPEPPR